MQPNLFPFRSNLGNPFLFDGDLSDDLETPPTTSVLFLLPFLLFQGGRGGIDLSKVSEKILSSVKSARSLGLLPPASDRPEFLGSGVSFIVCHRQIDIGKTRRYSIDSCVAYHHDLVPARAVAAAAVARAVAGLPPHQRYGLSSSSEEFSSIYGSKQHGQEVEEIEAEFCEQMGFNIAGKVVYSVVWIAAVSLFMDLLGFSTQKWLTVGGLSIVLLTLAGRECNDPCHIAICCQ